MGLGKTVQIAAFLMAVYNKSGRKSVDMPLNRSRSRQGYEELANTSSTQGVSESSGKDLFCPPCLIVAPASLITNWQQELDRWGYFLLATLDGKTTSLAAIKAAQQGRVEVVLGSYNKMDMYSLELAAVTWAVVIWDEGITEVYVYVFCSMTNCVSSF